MKQEDLIFALDIGTRTVIGLVIEYKESHYEILASEVAEHEERAMLDGQIHNVNEVARQVKKVKKRLEEKLEVELTKTAIAAAGRALKTVTCNDKLDLKEKRIITSDDVRTLEFSAVQKAQEELIASGQHDGPEDYHFVGYSVVEYLLDGIYIGYLEGQKGRKIVTKLIATFLPQVVIDSLFMVINMAGLKAEYLTLEPIAAANAVIPRDMYNFNLALVDIGAGTSDIALTRGGTMTGYDMVPVAGDEITEALAEHYLLDYKTGERLKRSLGDGFEEIKVKNILSQDRWINREEAIEAVKPRVEELVSLIGDSILTLNKQTPQVVICIGGGSLTPLLLESLTDYLGLTPDRVGIRKGEDIKDVTGSVDGVSSTQVITPIGIAIVSHRNKEKTNLLEVEVNGQHIQIFTLKGASVADALLTAGIDFKRLQGRPGMGLTCYLNGKLKVLKGSMGEAGKVLLNDNEADLNDPVNSGDKIVFKPGKNGRDAAGIVADIVPELKSYRVRIDGNPVELKSQVFQEGKLVDPTTPVKDGAEIEYQPLKTIRDGIVQLLELSTREINNRALTISFNNQKKYLPEGKFLILEEGEPVDLDRPLTEGLDLKLIKASNSPESVADLCQHFNVDEKITVTFNGSQLEIPDRKYKVYCNGEPVGFDYSFSDGDKIICKPCSLRIKQVFEFINYSPSAIFEDSFVLLLNGNPASLEDKVGDGDKIEIKLK